MFFHCSNLVCHIFKYHSFILVFSIPGLAAGGAFVFQFSNLKEYRDFLKLKLQYFRFHVNIDPINYPLIPIYCEGFNIPVEVEICQWFSIITEPI